MAQARTELIDALAAEGVRASNSVGGAPPYVLILGEGIDPSHILRGEGLASFALRCVAGKADADATAAQLDSMKVAALSVLRELDGWRVGDVRRDGLRQLSGSELMTADVIGARMVEL